MPAILVDQSKEKSAILVDQNNPQELKFYANNSFRFTAAGQMGENRLFGWFEFAGLLSLQAGNEPTKSYGRSRRA